MSYCEYTINVRVCFKSIKIIFKTYLKNKLQCLRGLQVKYFLQGFSQLYFAILKKQLWSSQTDVFIGIVRPNYCYTICLQIVVIRLIPSYLILVIFYLYSEIHCMSHKNFFNFDFFPLRMGWGEIDLNPSLTFDLLAKFFLAEQTKDLIIAPINEPKDLSKKNSFFFFFFLFFFLCLQKQSSNRFTDEFLLGR